MIPCKKTGSFCPSSDTLNLLSQCQPMKTKQLGIFMGCGGAQEELPCPVKFYPTFHISSFFFVFCFSYQNVACDL